MSKEIGESSVPPQADEPSNDLPQNDQVQGTAPGPKSISDLKIVEDRTYPLGANRDIRLVLQAKGCYGVCIRLFIPSSDDADSDDDADTSAIRVTFGTYDAGIYAPISGIPGVVLLCSSGTGAVVTIAGTSVGFGNSGYFINTVTKALKPGKIKISGTAEVRPLVVGRVKWQGLSPFAIKRPTDTLPPPSIPSKTPVKGKKDRASAKTDAEDVGPQPPAPKGAKGKAPADQPVQKGPDFGIAGIADVEKKST